MTRERAWSAASVFMLRQAGFPADLLDGLHGPEVTEKAAAACAAEDEARAAAARLEAAVSAAIGPSRWAKLRKRLGELSSLQGTMIRDVRERLGAAQAGAVDEYEAALALHQERRQAFSAALDQRLAAQRDQVVAAFRDDVRLRDALLLSNDAQFRLFQAWLDGCGPATSPRKSRKRADVLTRYLQRFAMKNETNSHCGPFSVGRLGGPALSWVDGDPERRAYFTHWAADAIGRAFARETALRPYVRPRTLPLALRTGTEVRLYESITRSGSVADWEFVERAPRALTAVEQWVLERADGCRLLADLHDEWDGDHGEVGGAVARLAADGLLVDHFEVPVGDPEPLAALRSQLPAGVPAATAAGERLAYLERLVAEFPAARHERRVTIVEELKTAFTGLTGKEANRHGGQHYADRSVLYEECVSSVGAVTGGSALREFVTGELAVLYDLVLAGPRHRMRRERDLLARWFNGRFGPGAEVGLSAFYRAYFADRAEIVRECRAVDEEVATIGADLMDVLLAGHSATDREVEVDRAALEAFADRHPRTPGAVCNPDLMLAASSREAIDGGDFLAVVGDCHALRELLLHTSVSPLLAERAPGAAREILGLYTSILDDGEILCDVVRMHRDKTDAQVGLPVPDVEFLGRSRKERSDVLAANRLRVRHWEDRVELRADGLAGRLRLLAPPATGPSIARDPLAVFSFPRYFGGIAIGGEGVAHLPRIRCGRVVLQRELWRIECAELVGDGPADADEFLAATRTRQRHGIPRRVFAKPAGEPKPVFVDFESPLLVRQLAHLARRSPGTVVVTEMLPDVDDLWLEAGGRKHTSELRLAVFS